MIDNDCIFFLSVFSAVVAGDVLFKYLFHISEVRFFFGWMVCGTNFLLYFFYSSCSSCVLKKWNSTWNKLKIVLYKKILMDTVKFWWIPRVASIRFIEVFSSKNSATSKSHCPLQKKPFTSNNNFSNNKNPRLFNWILHYLICQLNSSVPQWNKKNCNWRIKAAETIE